MPQREFHVHLHGPPRQQDETTNDSPQMPAPIPTSFEEAISRLEKSLPSVLVEPDGSIAWASPSHQVVGIIYDSADEIRYVELRGHCTKKQIHELCSVIAGTEKIEHFAVITLPEGQWNNFQSFANSLAD